jgi:CheY-like chemotaxis protein
MSNHDDLTKEEVNHLDDMNLNLKVVRKMISIIGGTFLIDGNKYYGTTINITIDQKMGELYQTKEEKQIESYSESLKNQKRCAIITENKSSIKVIKSVLKKQNYKVEEFNRAKDVLDILRNNEVFDLIFIDEYMDKIDARTFISKVKVIENFKGKVIVISKVKDIKNKKELLDLGFKGIILEPVNKKEVQGKFENL